MGRCRPSLFQGFTYGHRNLTCTARESEQTQLLHGKLARESFRLGSPRHVLCCWDRPLAFETYQFLTFLSPLSLLCSFPHLPLSLQKSNKFEGILNQQRVYRELQVSLKERVERPQFETCVNQAKKNPGCGFSSFSSVLHSSSEGGCPKRDAIALGILAAL